MQEFGAIETRTDGCTLKDIDKLDEDTENLPLTNTTDTSPCHTTGLRAILDITEILKHHTNNLTTNA